MTAVPQLDRVVRASTDRHGQVWLTVEYTDGDTVDLELDAVPNHLKAAFVQRLGGLGDLDVQARALLEDLHRQGYRWLATRIRELNDLGAKYHEVERRAEHFRRIDLLSMARERRAELRKISDALYDISAHLFPSETLGALPALSPAVWALLVGAAKFVLAVGILAASGLAAYAIKKDAEIKELRAVLDSLTPEQRADVARARFGRRDDDILDKVIDTAKTVAVIGVSAYLGAKLVPWAVAKVTERRAAA